MDLVTLCPFVASKIVWQANSGAFALTVIVKATFVLQPGTAELALEQEPIIEQDRFYDDDPRRSIRVPSDVVPYKPRADVMLVGHAHAPGKQPVRSLVTRFVVGEMDKSIEVWCDRAFRVRDGQLLEGKRFTSMPLVWELTSGGGDSANPVGKRFDGPMDTYGTITIGNLQPLGHFVSNRSDRFAPTCYGPVAPGWPGRTQRLGRLSRSILARSWHLQKLPPDLDPSFFQAAPPDQNVAEIRANERIVLENLHPDQTRLVTNLPGLTPRAIADRATGEREEIKLVGDTLWMDTDRGVCCVVWRGRIGLRHPEEAGRIAIWVDGMVMSAPNAPKEPRQTIEVMDEAPELVTTMVPIAPKQPVALPFVPGASSLAQSNTFSVYSKQDEADDGTGTMFVSMNTLGAKATPFEVPGLHAEVGHTPPSPFVTGAGIPVFAAVAPEPPMVFPAPFANERSGWEEPAVAPAMPRPIAMESAKTEDVAPPAMIGPLAKVEMPADAAPKSGRSAAQGSTVETEVADKEDKENDSDIPDLSLEETATIAAELAEGQIERAKVLEAHQLTERAWTKNEERWEAALEDEDADGKNELAVRYDAAYVKRVEGFRGAITRDDYTKLVVGMERGREEAVMKELGIQEEALLPIMRLWAKKMAGDVGLAGSGRAA